MFMFYVMDQRVYKGIRVFETVNELKAKEEGGHIEQFFN